MAYINFKEEKSAINNQLRKREKNNEKLRIEIINNKSKISLIGEEQYSYKTIYNITINNNKKEPEDQFIIISDQNYIGSKFINCKFYNIKFVNCNFIGCEFIKCDFGGGGVIFECCNFLQETINKNPSLNKKDNFSCKFKYTKLYCKFVSTTLSYCIFDECDINECFFSVSEIISIIIARSQMKKVEFQDVDLSGAKFIDNYIEDLEFSDKVKSKLDTKTFFDKINPIKKTKEEYEGIYKVYEEIANVFSENMLKNNFGEYYYLAQNSKRKSLNGVTKIKSYIAWFVFGYGERIVFPIITSAIIILVFSILYLIVGIDVEGEIVSIIFQKYPKNFIELGSAINESLNLSVGMFAGVGINKSMPLTSSYFLSDMEMIIGIIMMGIGIGSITRKIIR